MKNQWDERYSESEYFYGVSPNTFLKESASLLKPQSKVLCIGDGEGRNSVYLAQLHHSVTALDISQVGLEKMLALAKANNVEVTPLLADLASYTFEPNQWDAIISIWCHTPSPLRQRVHEQIKASLKEHGLFVLEAYTPEQLKYKTGGPQDVDMLVTLKELKAQFADYDWLIATETIRDVIEGKGHKGQSAVVQFVAQKKS